MPLRPALVRCPALRARPAALLGLALAWAVGCAPPKEDDRGAQPTPGAEPTPGAPAAPPPESTAGAAADADGVDNDCDAQVDEPDERELRPLFRFDRDADGAQYGDPFAACALPDGAAPFSGFDDPLDCDDRDPRSYPGADERCADRGDEDCDGLADCDDPDCALLPCAEDCADPVDNDADGLDDCADPDCRPGTCSEDCAAGGDRDRDGRAGCADPDCYGPACAEDCMAEGDEDGDGLADCEDTDCDDVCAEDCMAEGDEDLDGRPDCADEDCALRLPCWSNLELTLGGGGQLLAQRTHTQSYRSSQRSTSVALQISDVVVSGSSAGGELRCAAALSSLNVRRQSWYIRRSVGRDTGVVTQTTGVVSGALGADCPAPLPSELGAIELHLAVWAVRPRSPGEPAFLFWPDHILTDRSGPARWAASGLHLGPVVGAIRRRSSIGGVTTTSAFSQTAAIDDFLRVE